MALDFVSNEELIREARRRLPQGAWDYLVGGSESETTLRRNRAAFDRIAFRPRVLVDVSNIDTSTTFLGHRLRIPVLVAPIGSLQLITPDGGAAAAAAAIEFGTIDVIKEFAGLPFILKGVSTAEDAELAVEHGVDAVWVSNHGGRQLDHGRGSMSCLPEIVAAVKGRAEIVVDGGVHRGTDVLKA